MDKSRQVLYPFLMCVLVEKKKSVVVQFEVKSLDEDLYQPFYWTQNPRKITRLKSRISIPLDLILAKASAMRISIPLDLALPSCWQNWCWQTMTWTLLRCLCILVLLLKSVHPQSDRFVAHSGSAFPMRSDSEIMKLKSVLFSFACCFIFHEIHGRVTTMKNFYLPLKLAQETFKSTQSVQTRSYFLSAE